MKRECTNNGLVWTRAALITLLTLTTGGCSMVQSKSDVIGEYRLSAEKGQIALRVTEDGHFTEDISWLSGRHEKLAGSWFWNSGVLGFDRLWIPREFAPDYVQHADADAKDQPKYTEPGLWTIRPEKHWGTVTLSIFPDNDESFKKIR